MSGEQENIGLLRTLLIKPDLEHLGVAPGQEHADSGSGSTVYHVSHLLYGDSALKVFDLHGSERLTVFGMESYKTQTNRMRAEVAGYRDDLIERSTVGDDGLPVTFSWSVNPVRSVGLVRLDDGRTVPYSLSPWITGISLGDLFSYPWKTPYERLMGNQTVSFLREEFGRFERLFRWNHEHDRVRLLALNVVARRRTEDRFDLVITNIREFADGRSRNPVASLFT